MVETLKEALLDLYLDVKVRSNKEVRLDVFVTFMQLSSLNDDKLKQEREELLQKLTPETIIEYIRSSIEILLNLNTQRGSLDDATSSVRNIVDISGRQLFKGQKRVMDLSSQVVGADSSGDSVLGNSDSQIETRNGKDD